jgi:hypothetical protein
MFKRAAPLLIAPLVAITPFSPSFFPSLSLSFSSPLSPSLWPSLSPSLAASLSASLAADEAVLLAVPYVRQTKALCGGASAAMVFRFWGDGRASAESFAPLVDRRAGGIASDALAQAIENRGWKSVQFTGTIDSLKDRMRSGQPVVVLTHERGERYHYVVAIGFARDYIVLHDPARGPSRRVKIDRFVRAWAAAGSWALLVLPSSST